MIKYISNQKLTIFKFRVKNQWFKNYNVYNFIQQHRGLKLIRVLGDSLV